MRIIAGTHRSRKLLGPVDRTTRPITDRVKTALFDRLASAGRLEEAVVLDMFAGTGSLGLECLSRGAVHVTFIERDRIARQRLDQNLAAIGQSDQAAVLAVNALATDLASRLPAGPYTLLFVDPPYAMLRSEADADRVYGQIERLAASADADALLVLRSFAGFRPPTIAPWVEPVSYAYGSMSLHHFALGR